MRCLGMRWTTRLAYVGCLLVLGGLLSSLGWAEEWKTYPPSGTLTFKGLDDTSAPTQAEDGRASALQNVKLGTSADLQQRFGYSLVGDTLDDGANLDTGVDEAACAVTGLYYTKFSSGTERIVSTCGDSFSYLNGTTWTEVSGIDVAITAGQDYQFVWATALDEIIGTNDVNPPLRYNGTALNTVDFTDLDADERPTAVKTVAFFKNFLILGNTVEQAVSYPTRIRWSNVGTIGDWTEGDYIDIGALGGQEINAMAELYDNLYVFLTDSIYRISFVAGADTFHVSKVTEDIGSIAKNSIQSITLSNNQNGLIFLDKDKEVYFFNGIVVQSVSDFIEDTMDGLSATGLQYASSVDTNQDYYLCVRNGTTGYNNLCLDFQYLLGEWTKHTNINANAMASVLDSTGRHQAYAGSYESFVYQLDDEDLVDDVGTQTGAIDSTSRIDTAFASGLLVLYDEDSSLPTGILVGAPLQMVGGNATGEIVTIVEQTVSGMIVSDDFSETLAAGATYEVGAIDSFYTTKWYDLGEPNRLKHYGEIYFWADEGEASGIDVSFATDLNTDISTQTISLDAATTDAIWGSAIWGTSRWGSSADVFRQVKLESEGRYIRVKWDEDDPNQGFRIYNWSFLYQPGENN